LKSKSNLKKIGLNSLNNHISHYYLFNKFVLYRARRPAISQASCRRWLAFQLHCRLI